LAETFRGDIVLAPFSAAGLVSANDPTEIPKRRYNADERCHESAGEFVRLDQPWKGICLIPVPRYRIFNCGIQNFGESKQ
jgi:hypothetical protein